MTRKRTGEQATDCAQDRAREEFLTHPLGRLARRHATPAVASMLFMAFYQITDGIMAGRSLGPEAMASVNVLYPIVALLSGLAVMIGVGGNARIAVLLGAGRPREAGRVPGLIVCLGVALGIVGSAAAVVLMPWILSILGTSGLLGHFAAGYLRGILPFFTFMILTFILEQSIRNDGKPNLAGCSPCGGRRGRAVLRRARLQPCCASHGRRERRLGALQQPVHGSHHVPVQSFDPGLCRRPRGGGHDSGAVPGAGGSDGDHGHRKRHAAHLQLQPRRRSAPARAGNAAPHRGG